MKKSTSGKIKFIYTLILIIIHQLCKTWNINAHKKIFSNKKDFDKSNFFYFFSCFFQRRRAFVFYKLPFTMYFVLFTLFELILFFLPILPSCIGVRIAIMTFYFISHKLKIQSHYLQFKNNCMDESKLPDKDSITSQIIPS